jgi:hypothetical protein
MEKLHKQFENTLFMPCFIILLFIKNIMHAHMDIYE